MKSSRSRMMLVCMGAVLLFSGFSSRLIYLQVTRHAYYSALAAEKHIVRKPIYAQRGAIIDAQGETLADNISVKTVYADATHLKDRERVAEIVARHLHLDPAAVTERLARNSQYIVLKKEVDQITAHALEDELALNNLKGIYYNQDYQRFYPNGDMLSHVIGFLDSDHRGVLGLERGMDSYLQGRDGFRYTERDRKGQEVVLYRGQERPAQDGYTVQSTIDLGLQNIVETELRAAALKYSPESATIIMMEPRTGAVLAMACWPSFDVNNAGNIAPGITKNHAIVDGLEPGSTFKIVTTSAAIQERTVTSDTEVYCEEGKFFYKGRTLGDHKPYGMLNVHDILMKSSNIGVAKLALGLGDHRLYEYARLFGFGERTGIDLPGENPGLVHAPASWDSLTITRMPMGQAVRVTPIQVCNSMCVIANGGLLMMPQTVSRITTSAGKPVAQFTPVVVRRVISRDTAEVISSGLRDVVTKTGTAPEAAVPGYRVAGKTGTAQIPDPKGGYVEGRHNLSFCGYIPAENPAFVAYVLVNSPRVPHDMDYGGQVAAPIFASLAAKAVDHFDLQPDPSLLADQLKLVKNEQHDRD